VARLLTVINDIGISAPENKLKMEDTGVRGIPVPVITGQSGHSLKQD
jgi:hypothetical protein